MIFPNYTHKVNLMIIFLGLLSPASFVYPRQNIFYSIVKVSFYMCLARIVACSTAKICQRVPNLYEQKNSNEELLQLIEERTNQWRLILEKPTEYQLLSFRVELIQYYKKILSNRSILSNIFEHEIPEQPWALFNLEMQQYLNTLGYLQARLFNRTFTVTDLQTITYEEETSQFLNRIKKAEALITEIILIIESYPSFQSECSQARQEKMYISLIRDISILSCTYLLFQQAKYLDKYCD